MKMKRLLAATLLGTLGLVGCGDGMQSPDFTAQLTALTLTAPETSADTQPGAPAGQRTVPSGQSTPLVVTGTYTTPPGSANTSVEVTLTDVDFEVSPTDPSTTIVDGVFRSTDFDQVVTIVANKDGETSAPLRIRIGPAVLTGLKIDPSSASIPLGGTRTFSALGTYTDDVDRPQAATFTEASTAISFTGTTASTATVRGDAFTSGTPAVLTATATVGGTNYTAQSSITVDGKTITGVQPAASCDVNPIGIGISTTCRATLTYSDGTTGPADGLVTWMSATPGVATIDANTGVATGVAAGSSLLTATLSSPTGGTNDSATVTLGVLASANSACPSPLVAPNAVTSTAFSQLCVGCTVTNPEDVIDDDAASFGSINVTAGLLTMGTATLKVNALPNTTNLLGATPRPVGFIVAQPAGLLLSAEVLSTLTVSTIDNAGQVIQSGGAIPQDLTLLPLPPEAPGLPLRVTLLGTLGGQDLALVTVDPTLPFNGLGLTFNAGLVSLLPSINVYQACAVANPDPVVP